MTDAPKPAWKKVKLTDDIFTFNRMGAEVHAAIDAERAAGRPGIWTVPPSFKNRKARRALAKRQR